ncbi:LysR family transcriptional regulator [Lysobacter solisilvae (ex Woo and Kim 2020)]|uniref:LysR family transcriptional regulator n=1 Tax=Agrilutibacter terrestris TaxID=2865112 RepID=A0A7H0FWG2_9GAMM|nr:LysR family transcriptional regulator [Lysobacter terrestris]QNP40378.1 LysR family transcriptional regulator [Lysobacter terrestris]
MSRDLPPLNALRAFEAVARLDSVSRAAQELHVTHGAISRQLRVLEDAAGTALFARQGRGLVLTAAGRRLYEAADAAFAPLRSGWTELQQRSAHAPLVLGCPGSVLARWVIPRLERLSREQPELKLHLSASDSIPDAGLSGLDAALLIAQAPWPPEWQVHALAPERIGPVVSPRFAGFERVRSAPPEVLLELPLLHTASRPQAWGDWAGRAGLDAGALRLGTGFEHLYYLLEATEAGLGVAIAPEPLVAEDIAAGRLVAPWGFVATQAQWVLCASRRREDRRIAKLASWLRDALADAH